MHKRYKLTLLAVMLAGCSMEPTYHRPEAPVPAAWPAKHAVKEGVRIAKDGDWHEYFTDPRLQRLIETALENNRDLRIATARIAEARAQYGIQAADRLPNFNLNATRNASLTPAGTSAFTQNALRSQRYDVNVSLVSFELDFWGRVASLSTAAKASYFATEEAQRAFRLSLVADVANAYLSLLELDERARLAKSVAESRGEYRRLVGLRKEQGMAGDMEALQAEGAWQTAVAAQSAVEQQRAAAANLLDQFVGRRVADIPNLPEGRALDQQDIAVEPLADLPAETLLRRPDVLAAEQRLIAANANIGAARAAFLPRIALTGSAGTASRTLNGLFDAGSGAWSFQPSITLPLFSGGRGTSTLDLAEARKVIAVAEYEKTIQQAFREIADLLDAREKLAEQANAQQANAAAQASRLKLVEARYREGIASRLDLLDAQAQSDATRQTALQSRRAQLSAMAQLYKALGMDDSKKN